jgi:hypothetical protein
LLRKPPAGSPAGSQENHYKKTERLNKTAVTDLRQEIDARFLRYVGTAYSAFQAGAILPRFAFGGLAIDEQAETFIERQLADLRVLRLAGQGAGHAGEAQLVEFVDGRMVQHG